MFGFELISRSGCIEIEFYVRSLYYYVHLDLDLDILVTRARFLDLDLDLALVTKIIENVSIMDRAQVLDL